MTLKELFKTGLFRCELIDINDNFDIATLISNGADFMLAIEEIKALGKQVVNVSFPNKITSFK